MNGTGRVKGILLLTAFLIAAVILSSCVQKETSDIENAETRRAVWTAKTTQKSTPSPTPSPTKKPTPIPTKKPTPTGTPTPSPTVTPAPVTAAQSVYIPVEPAADGRLLADGYFAVLSGESGYYNIYDCFGTYVDSFFFVSGYQARPRNIMTEGELSIYYRPNEDEIEVTSVDPERYEYSNLITTENGFYWFGYGERQTIVILYNPAGEKIQTLEYSIDLSEEERWVYADVYCVGEETFVCFTLYGEEEVIYFIAPDGAINNKYIFESRDEEDTYNYFPEQILGRKHYIHSGTIYDLSDKVVMEDVETMQSFTDRMYGFDGYEELILSDYFIKDGKTYNSSLKLVTRNTRDKDGNLIYGVEYDVDGIECQAIYDKKNYHWGYYFWSEELVAVGYGSNQIAVQTKENSYTFQIENGYQFDGINNHMMLLRHEKNGTVQMISLETGKVINIVHNFPADEIMNIRIADEYVIVEKAWTETGDINNWEDYKSAQYVVDKEGNVRYFTENAYIDCAVGEYIQLERGPYCGIADLNGEWILKSLIWDINNDTEYTYGGY